MPHHMPHLRIHGLLQLAPHPELSAQAAASLLATPLEKATAVLELLAANELADQIAPNLYRLREPAPAPKTLGLRAQCEARAARRRLVDYYLHTAHAADRMISPNHPALDLAAPTPGCRPVSPATPQEALAWLDAEHQSLIAVRKLALREGWYEAVWHLAASLNGHFVRRGHFREQLDQWNDALTAVHALDDIAAHVTAHRFFGQASTRAGDHAQAAQHLQLAITAAVHHPDPAVGAQAHYIFAWVLEQDGRYEEALAQAGLARDLFHITGPASSEADSLNAVGWYHALLGNRSHATKAAFEALQISRRNHYREGAAAALDSLALMAQQAGLYNKAAERYLQSLELCRELGNTYQEAGILERLGQVYAAAGDPHQAHIAWTGARALYQEQQRHSEAETVAQQLAAFSPGNPPALLA